MLSAPACSKAVTAGIVPVSTGISWSALVHGEERAEVALA